MAEKKPSTEDLTQPFLRALLRRVGGGQMDVGENELEAADQEGLSAEVEVVRVPMIEDSERAEGQEIPNILRLRPKE